MAGVLWQPSRLREVMGTVERLLPQVMPTVHCTGKPVILVLMLRN